MKLSQITLIVICFIILALMATNPSIEDHRQAVMEKMKEKMAESSNSDSKNEWQKAGEAIGMAIGQGIVEKAVGRDNYLLFSLTKSSFGDNVKYIGLGVLGKVYFIDNLNETYNESAKSVNPIIGNTIKIGNLEVAEKDFPTQMSWKEAKSACEALGEGWRLPQKDEYVILSQNKEIIKIGGFNKYYWTGSKIKVDFSWIFYFDTNPGFSPFLDGYEPNEYCVRAVRDL
jgi:hypothetical protein